MPSLETWPESPQSLPARGQCGSVQRAGVGREDTLPIWGGGRMRGEHSLSFSWASLKGALSLCPRRWVGSPVRHPCERDDLSLPEGLSPRSSRQPRPLPLEEVRIFWFNVLEMSSRQSEKRKNNKVVRKLRQLGKLLTQEESNQSLAVRFVGEFDSLLFLRDFVFPADVSFLPPTPHFYSGCSPSLGKVWFSPSSCTETIHGHRHLERESWRSLREWRQSLHFTDEDTEVSVTCPRSQSSQENLGR